MNNELEQQFRKAIAEAKPEIDKRKVEIKRLWNECVKISNKTGIPFHCPIGRNPYYVPGGFESEYEEYEHADTYDNPICDLLLKEMDFDVSWIYSSYCA